MQLERCVRAAGGAISANTERAVRSDLGIHAEWYLDRVRKALPASAETVASFIDAMAETRKPATVRRYVASIAAALRAVGSGKTLKRAPVQLVLQRMHRSKGHRRQQVQGLTWPLRQRPLTSAGEKLIDIRNRALPAVAYDAMLRRSERTALQGSDLPEGIPGHATLLVRRSKTDAEGLGEIVYPARDTVRLVRARLFRSVGKGHGLGERRDPSQVSRIFKAMAARAGVPERVVQGLSGHSARMGAAQDMIAAGIELPAILRAGRWKSTAMVNRYGERLLAQRSGVARLARLQERKLPSGRRRGMVRCQSRKRGRDTCAGDSRAATLARGASRRSCREQSISRSHHRTARRHCRKSTAGLPLILVDQPLGEG